MNLKNGTVRIVGAGLLGTSIGLALTKQGIDVVITSQTEKSSNLAVQYGAGRLAKSDDKPILIVVCVPPENTAKLIAEELQRFPNAVVTDVASVKESVLDELIKLDAPIERYVGSHPMAGRERGGAIAGRADLFVGRPWVITANSKSSQAAIEVTRELARSVESSVIEISARDHDRAAALISHVPQLISSLLAARLVSAEPNDVALAGQGIRDTTRIAASDPKLWIQILSANSDEVLEVLRDFSKDLDDVISAMGNLSVRDNLEKLMSALEKGNLGVEKLPGKHGSKQSEYAQVTVMIDDSPGELARLLTEVGELGINLEELKLEHSPSAQIGLVELYILPAEEFRLTSELTARNWRIA